MPTPDQSKIFEAIVIGTGFAGAVTACRLVEAGFEICVLERGRRYGPDDFPRYPSEDLFSTTSQDDENFAPPPDFSRWLWSQDQGIYDIRDLDDVLSVQAAGFGGGSLIYANVHLRPPREVFEHGWPEEYAPKDGRLPLEPYFDLAAYTLRVSPIPKRLAKTVQLEKAGQSLTGSSTNWFRTPLAVNFDERSQTACDMRGRCCLGCDRGAKHTLDKNYLARAESGRTPPDVRTLAEVTRIDHADGVFTVTYNDLLFRRGDGQDGYLDPRPSVRARHVFLCAGSVNTTELLMKNSHLWEQERQPSAASTPLGSHYFPNSDSVAGVFSCKDPHEADYGPTITSAILFRRTADEEFSCSLDFLEGRLEKGQTIGPPAGATIRGRTSQARARLQAVPLLDWGSWTSGAAGALVLAPIGKRHFEPGEVLELEYAVPGDERIAPRATAQARSADIQKTHWLMAEDGGYPPHLEPLMGVLRSPVWLRRNRYVEFDQTTDPLTPSPPRRSAAQHLSVESLTNSLGGTASRAGSGRGPFNRIFDPSRFRATDLLVDQISAFFPPWFVKALRDDHADVLEHAAAMALPLLDRLLGQLSKTVAQQLDSRMIASLVGERGGPTVTVTDDKKQVLIRGILRQSLQVLAGSEATVASRATTLLLDPLPATPEKLLRLLGDVLLWAIAYGSHEGHTGVILTMGRDLYRGRLDLVSDGFYGQRLTARLPSRLLDSSGAMQERVLRVIAKHWGGELRTNPTWAVLDKRLTVHSQGGCPMGSNPDASVTSPLGEVHKCKGLFVMDAAAFPTSVGVNPSATIAAVAEFKIERFICKRHQDKEWCAQHEEEKRQAARWVTTQGRARIDPLNHGTFSDSSDPALAALALTFTEHMEGSCIEVPAFPMVNELETQPNRLRDFVEAEDQGNRRGSLIAATLTAKASNLARLITTDRDVNPTEMSLSGTVTLDGQQYRVNGGSVVQLFVPPARHEIPPLRFFCYRVSFTENGHESRLDGVKLLRDAPGFDVWSDTSTLYFEISGAGRLRRGILRISVEHLQDQLRSIDVTGTHDPARKSWALAAFYRYFIGELSRVYVRRADVLKELFVKAATSINV